VCAVGRLWHELGRAFDGWLPRSADVEVRSALEGGWLLDKPDAYCPRCGLSAGPGGRTALGCSACVDRPLPWRRLVRLAPYAPPVDRWILAMKFAGDWSWSTWFGQRLAERIASSSPSGRVALCPVPMHWLRRGRRGYNQAQLLARAVAACTGWPIVPLVRRRALGVPHSRLGAAGRQQSAARAYAPAAIDARGWTVWLVDDVKTTGATLGACAHAIRRTGADCVDVAVVAATDPGRHAAPRPRHRA
jgi:ComF family protein